MGEQVVTEAAKAQVAVSDSHALVANTSVKVLSHNDSRSSFLLSNDGATDAWVSYGAADAVAHKGHYLPIGGALGDDDWPGEVHAISTGATNVCFVEKSYAVGDDEGEQPTGASTFAPAGPGDAAIPAPASTGAVPPPPQGVGPFFVHDSFTDANGTPLAAHHGEVGADWVPVPGLGSGMVINAGKVSTSASEDMYTASGAPPNPDYEVSAVISAGGPGQVVGIVARVSDHLTGYDFHAYNGAYHLTSRASATPAADLVAIATPPTSGDLIMLRVKGSKITALVNGVQVAQVDNADTATAGFAGVYGLFAGAAIDDFRARALAGSADPL